MSGICAWNLSYISKDHGIIFVCKHIVNKFVCDNG